jgi:predicted nucleotidyltransferase component of viral defense system
MIPLIEINAAAVKFKIPISTIEKDYIISWILLSLMQNKFIGENFIFYGGTAIKRIFFESHRFSEDIDLLSYESFSLEELKKNIKVIKYAAEEANIALNIDHGRTTYKDNRVQMYIEYEGYEEITGVPKEIRIDLNMKMDSFGKIEFKNVIKSYSDISSEEKIKVMSLNTILANKLGLLTELNRNEPRDVFDIWFLLNRRKQFNFNFSEVCETFRKKYGYYPNLSVLESGLNGYKVKKNWEIRLQDQISELPKVDVVTNAVERELLQLFSRK